jgi:hypothetical protein
MVNRQEMEHSTLKVFQLNPFGLFLAGNPSYRHAVFVDDVGSLFFNVLLL